MSRIVVVGLGPAGPELLTAEALAAIERIPHRFLRTTRHPAAVAVPDATSFDDRYEAEATMDAVYRGIVDDLVVAAAASTVRCSTPCPAHRRWPSTRSNCCATTSGSRSWFWRRCPSSTWRGTVSASIPWRRAPASSTATTSPWPRRGQPGRCWSASATGHRSSSDIKLSVEDPGDLTVTVLQRLGLPDERVTEVTWNDLDRVVEPDHLTSLWIPALAAPVAAELQRFAEVVRRLRAECPWDREQTHQSLTRHLIEESYEVLDAIELLSTEEDEGYAALEEELGDLLFQVVFHATLGAEEGRFTLADVARGIHDKLVLRHPHVFAAVEVDGADEVVANWEAIKKEEKGRDSVFDGIPRGLPALLFALKIEKKAAATGLLDRVPPPEGNDLGAELLAIVTRARDAGIDPEDALRRTAAAWQDALRAAESDG